MSARKPTPALRWRKQKYDCGTRQWRSRLGPLVIWVEELGDHGDYFPYGFGGQLGVASTRRDAQLAIERLAHERLRKETAAANKALTAYRRARAQARSDARRRP